MVDLNETNYQTLVDRIINLKDELKNNLKDFKYHQEIDEWIKVFNEKNVD